MADKETALLRVDGLRFHSTWQKAGREQAEKVIRNFAKYGEKLILRDYGVRIHTVNPKSNSVISWDKVVGFSLWGE